MGNLSTGMAILALAGGVAGLAGLVSGIVTITRRIIQPAVLEETDKRYPLRTECIQRHAQVNSDDTQHAARLVRLEADVGEIKGDLKVTSSNIEWIRSSLERREM